MPMNTVEFYKQFGPVVTALTRDAAQATKVVLDRLKKLPELHETAQSHIASADPGSEAAAELKSIIASIAEIEMAAFGAISDVLVKINAINQYSYLKPPEHISDELKARKIYYIQNLGRMHIGFLRVTAIIAVWSLVEHYLSLLEIYTGLGKGSSALSGASGKLAQTLGEVAVGKVLGPILLAKKVLGMVDRLLHHVDYMREDRATAGKKFNTNLKFKEALKEVIDGCQISAQLCDATIEDIRKLRRDIQRDIDLVLQ
jgi:hypothetical protein